MIDKNLLKKDFDEYLAELTDGEKDYREGLREYEDGKAEADEKILEAHKSQTEMIQRQAGGEEVEYSLLFVHAQDTLMTISAELHMAKKMMPVVRALAAK